MVIPVGLLSETEKQQRRTRGRDDQGYWQGNSFVFPRAKNPAWPSPQAMQAAQAAVQAAQQVQQSAQAFPGLLHTGDGPQGEGFSGGREGAVAPGNSQSFSESGHVNAPDQNANVQGMMNSPAPTNPAGLPSLPSFQEQAAPQAAQAQVDPVAAEAAAAAGVPGSDANAPSGGKAGKSAPGSATNPAAEAAAVAAGLGRANVDKAIQEKGFIDGIKGLMDQSRGLLGASVAAGAEAAAAAAAEAAGPAGVAGSEQNSPNSVGGAMGGGGGSSDSTGSGASGTSGTGPNAGDEGGLGAWRKGGSVRGNHDGRLQPVPGILHEGEFVQKPEAVSYYGDRFMHAINERRIPKKAAMGLLADLEAKPQSKRIDRGLLGI